MLHSKCARRPHEIEEPARRAICLRHPIEFYTAVNVINCVHKQHLPRRHERG